MKDKSILFGIAFGFVLSRIGATEYATVTGMFQLRDLQLVGVIGSAIVICAIGFALIAHRRMTSLLGEPIVLAHKPLTKTLVPGALVFGIGWALSGTCPGTALAQIGEGRVAALATFAGILLGALLVRSKAAAPEPTPVSDDLERLA